MSVAFYMDQHVPAAITAGLRDRGLDVLTDLKMGHRTGKMIESWSGRHNLVEPCSHQMTIFSRLLVNGREFAGLVYVHQRRTTIGQAMADLELIATVFDADEMYNRIEFRPI